MFRTIQTLFTIVCSLAVCSSICAAEFSKGSVKLDYAGPMTFGPKGVLFVGDPLAASIYAIDTGDADEAAEHAPINVKAIDRKIAESLGVKPQDILINDLAVNPDSGVAYFSVMRGKGPDAIAVILKIDAKGEVSELDLSDVSFSKAELPNAPSKDKRDRRGRSQRMISITDLSFVNDQVVVAGLTNEDFASNLRSIPYPFKNTPDGVSIEIYHGAHGRYETRSPVRTFAPILVDNEPYLIAAYTCTPLVRFPLSALNSEEDKVKGTTVAELGNRNTPLDMVVYEKGGKQMILMSNTARGVMKIETTEIARKEGITERIRDTEGQEYETIESLTNVVHLDKLDSSNALVLIQNGDKSHDLKTVALP